MPAELGYIEGENGDNANFSVSIVGKRISCACGCICNSTRNSINIARRR
jgi:hypothetical protein